MSTDNFMQAATRHLADAQLLLNHQHLDNAVYLAGYTVECTLKGFLEIYITKSQVRRYSHDIVNLHEAAFSKLYILYPQLKSEIHFSHEEIEDLAKGHPERRYWASDYHTPESAEKIVKTAEDVYKKTIPPLLLDGLIKLEEV